MPNAICNAIGMSHCGREITGNEVAYSSSAFVKTAIGCTPRKMLQCRDCAEKDEAIATACGDQRTWAERRQGKDKSQGEAARALGIMPSEYSSYERLRVVAPAGIVATFDEVFPKEGL